MPVYDRKQAAGFERVPNAVRQARSVGNAVKGIRHKHEVGGPPRKGGNFIGVAPDVVAVCYTAFGQPLLRHRQQAAVNVDCDDVARDFGDLERKPAITGAQIYRFHAGFKSGRGKYSDGIGP
jgi:hypothetical protein